MGEIISTAPMLAQASNEEKPPKSAAAQELKRKQVESLSPEERREIARKAAKARWTKKKRKRK